MLINGTDGSRFKLTSVPISGQKVGWDKLDHPWMTPHKHPDIRSVQPAGQDDIKPQRKQ